MLSLVDKIEIFSSILCNEETSYADSFNGQILLVAQNFDFRFFNKALDNFIDFFS